MMERRNKTLIHYSSQYYDPVKAHEYYIKNRQLKGRSTSGMSEKQKEAWAYAKDNITTEKRSKVELQKNTREQKIEALKTQAEETRNRISEKLKKLSELLTKRAEEEREKIEVERQSKIDRLPPIPKGISSEQRAILMEKRKKEIADIRNDAHKNKDDISDDTKEDRSQARDDASSERNKVRIELKNAIAAARDEYDKAKSGIDSNYEKVYQNEYDKIRSNVEGKTKTRRGRR